MAQIYAFRYLAHAIAGMPRDIANACLAKFRTIRPTVLIFNCTFVCDAQCKMCNNWKRGHATSDMGIDEMQRVFSSRFWHDIENVHISGGEPTTRSDLVESCRIILDKLPKLRKLGLSTTGLTPERAIPMLTRIVRLCAERDVLCSVRVAIDGVGQVHDDVRQVPSGFEQAVRTIREMQALQQRDRFNLGIAATIFSGNLNDARNILNWARRENLDVVFNMIRFTDPMLGNRELTATYRPRGADERRLRQFFLERIRTDSLLDGQNYIYMHYADMISNGYHRLAPCPFQTQGVMLNPDGGLFFCENSQMIGNVRHDDPGEIYFHASNQLHRNRLRKQQCPSCLSPCQINVSAIKRVVPYVKFLLRASYQKQRFGRRSAIR